MVSRVSKDVRFCHENNASVRQSSRALTQTCVTQSRDCVPIVVAIVVNGVAIVHIVIAIVLIGVLLPHMQRVSLTKFLENPLLRNHIIHMII